MTEQISIKERITKMVKYMPLTDKQKKKILDRWDKEVKEALKNGKGYKSAKEMHDDISGKQKHPKVFKEGDAFERVMKK